MSSILPLLLPRFWVEFARRFRPLLLIQVLLLSAPAWSEDVEGREESVIHHADGTISLTLEDEAIADLVKKIERAVGVSIRSLTPLEGRVTISLNKVDWKDGLDAILDLSRQRLGRTLGRASQYEVIPAHPVANLEWIRIQSEAVRDPGPAWDQPIRLRVDQVEAREALAAWAAASGLKIALETAALAGLPPARHTLAYENRSAEHVAGDLCETLGLKAVVWNDHLLIRNPQLGDFPVESAVPVCPACGHTRFSGRSVFWIACLSAMLGFSVCRQLVKR